MRDVVVVRLLKTVVIIGTVVGAVVVINCSNNPVDDWTCWFVSVPLCIPCGGTRTMFTSSSYRPTAQSKQTATRHPQDATSIIVMP